MPNSVPCLDAVMSYQHPGVIVQLRKKYQLSEKEATDLFEDTKRFLFIGATTPEAIAPSKSIDKCWHEFILFTRDYATFCRTRLGRFIHHVPNESGQRTNVLPAKVVAESFFGSGLSENWTITAADCEDCAPDTNCEAPPSDCALMHPDSEITFEVVSEMMSVSRVP